MQRMEDFCPLDLLYLEPEVPDIQMAPAAACYQPVHGLIVKSQPLAASLQQKE